MKLFTPTYLYIKQHAITGKYYFGKTTCKNPVKYPGSGTYWQRHLKEHGKECTVTLWYCLFKDEAECTKFALEFSEKMDIVKSDQWANLIPEDGLDGVIQTEEVRSKISAAHIGMKASLETCKKISIGNKGKIRSLKSRVNISNGHIGIKLSDAHKKNISINSKGRIVSAETRAKLSLAAKGKKLAPISLETRLKLSLAKRGKPHSDAHKAKISASLRARHVHKI